MLHVQAEVVHVDMVTWWPYRTDQQCDRPILPFTECYWDDADCDRHRRHVRERMCEVSCRISTISTDRHR